jgi:hypothetical protein
VCPPFHHFYLAAFHLAANFADHAPYPQSISRIGHIKWLNNMLQFKHFVASVLLQIASGFRVDFWGGAQCTDSPLGTWIGGPDQGCQRLFVGEAEGVTVESTGPVDDNTVVAFYSSSTCDLGTAIGESNVGCVSVDDSVSAYKSFNVIQSNTGFKYRERRWANTSLVTNPPSATDTTSLADLREQSDRFIASTHALARQHGTISNYQGQPYKWHQVAEGAWRGIVPEHWDDSIHIRNDTVIKYSETYPMDFSMNSPNTALSLYDPTSLIERNFLYATCGFLRTCTLGVVGGTQFVCSTIGNAFVNKVLSLSGQDIWEFLNQPFIVAITVDLAGEIIGGVVGAVTSFRLQASACSNSGTDADTLSSILAAFPADRAGQATITFNGVTGTFSFEAVPTDQRGDGNTCGAPSTDPSTGTASQALAFRA